MVKICGGQVAAGSGSAAFDTFVLDSRVVKPGNLFVPIPGRIDPHAFVLDALAGGAAAALISESNESFEQILEKFRRTYPSASDKALVAVHNTQQYLYRLAEWYRGKFAAKCIGVTGSVGKTVTKETIAHLLRAKFATVASERNYNTEIGVPLTVARLLPETEMLVSEMAMRHFGEIALLSRIVKPDTAVITNVRSTHFELLGSFENIALAKIEIVEGMKEGGTLFINCDDEIYKFVDETARRRMEKKSGRIVRFGASEDADISLVESQLLPDGSTHLRVRQGGADAEFIWAHPGVASVLNILPAVFIARELGITDETIRPLLADMPPMPQRAQIIRLKNGAILIDDSYNANPDSMREGLAILQGIRPDAKRIAVLGDMLELGGLSEQAHRALGSLAAESRLAAVVFVGNEVRHACEEARAEMGDACHFVPHEKVEEVELPEGKIQAAFDLIQPFITRDSVVLIKSSRALKLERLVKIIIDRFGESVG